MKAGVSPLDSNQRFVEGMTMEFGENLVLKWDSGLNYPNNFWFIVITRR